MLCDDGIEIHSVSRVSHACVSTGKRHVHVMNDMIATLCSEGHAVGQSERNPGITAGKKQHNLGR